MSDFAFVRTIEKCCICIELKTGSILIAIFALLDHTDFYIASHYPICENNRSHVLSILQSVINWLSIVSNITIFITSIAFIYGIVKGEKRTGVWFMYAILFSLIVRVLYVIVIVILGFLFSECKIIDYHILNKIIGFLIWFYFLSVIKSYKQQM